MKTLPKAQDTSYFDVSWAIQAHPSHVSLSVASASIVIVKKKIYGTQTTVKCHLGPLVTSRGIDKVWRGDRDVGSDAIIVIMVLVNNVSIIYI